jgi:predicted patatin/cPLA2 family phospholipase
MGKGKQIAKLLKPLNSNPIQYYLGTGLHTLGLLGWILGQTGRADVYVSTFSTSDAFLSGFLRLRKRGLINHSVLVADLKASKKTMQLYRLMQNSFDNVYLSMNHSKIVLVQNDKFTISGRNR